MTTATLATLRPARVTADVPRFTFVAAWLLVAVEAATVCGIGGPMRLGAVTVSPLAFACPPALWVACRALRGDGAPLRDDLSATASLWLPLVAGLVGPVVAWGAGASRLSSADALGLAIGAALEETVFRIAVPVCTWQVLRVLGWRRAAPVVATVAAVATFALMPGHLAQMTTPAAAVPFACLALLLLGVVWIGRDPLLAVATHFGVNAWMLAATFGAIPPLIGRVGCAAVVVPVGVALARRTRTGHGASRAARWSPLRASAVPVGTCLGSLCDPQVHRTEQVLDVERSDAQPDRAALGEGRVGHARCLRTHAYGVQRRACTPEVARLDLARGPVAADLAPRQVRRPAAAAAPHRTEELLATPPAPEQQ